RPPDQSALVYRTLTVARTAPVIRSTSSYLAWTTGPLPVASPPPRRASIARSSRGGGVFFGQAAAKHAVIVPTSAVDSGRTSATALLEYSVTLKASETSFVRCHPLMKPRLCFGTMT